MHPRVVLPNAADAESPDPTVLGGRLVLALVQQVVICVARDWEAPTASDKLIHCKLVLFVSSVRRSCKASGEGC